jgi:protein-tyrosine phosphatase
MEIVAINRQGTLLTSGDIDDWTVVQGYRVDTVVDLDGDVDVGLPEAPNEILYIYFPILDEDVPNLRKLDALGRLVADLVEGGHVVLVHCRMGLNRSNLLAATALTYLGMTGLDALTHIRGLRPGALFNEKFAEHLCCLPARRIRLEVLEPEGEPT